MKIIKAIQKLMNINNFYFVLTMLLIIGLTSCRLGDATGPGTNIPYIYHIGEINTPGFAYAVAASGNKAYIADGIGGLRIIDISMMHFPDEVAYYEDDGVYYDVKFSGGDHAYVAAGEAGFKIIDVNSPFGPELIGQYSTFNAFGLDFAGNYIYLADFTDGIKILDITSTYNVFPISSFSVSGQIVNNVTISWPYLYASARYGFSIIDISNPFAPLEVHFEPLSNVYDIEVMNQLAYIAYEGGLRIYDVSQPSDPQELGFCDLPATARSVQVRGDFAYLAIGSSGLSIVRITNPLQPFEIAYYNPVAGEMSDLLLFGRYLLIANGNAGFLILEFSPGY
ncbi:MAG: hypothetical protein K0B81_02030 [Candidatus Cloacimonetes bacterium]|nr:hypothetical protein [Candidatus Cloacimonadota bacterium]